MQNSRVMSLHGITDSKWLTKIINFSRKNPEAARRPHVNENPCNYTTFQCQPSVWKCYSSRFCFFFSPRITAISHKSVPMGWTGKGPLPRSNMTFDPPIHNYIVWLTAPLIRVTVTSPHIGTLSSNCIRSEQKGPKRHWRLSRARHWASQRKNEWTGQIKRDGYWATVNQDKDIPWWKELWTPDIALKARLLKQLGRGPDHIKKEQGYCLVIWTVSFMMVCQAPPFDSFSQSQNIKH